MVLMNGLDYIELNSVGTVLTKQLNTHPIMADGTVDKGFTVHVYDLTDEWWSNLSFEDGCDALEFIELNTDIISPEIFNDWKVATLGLIGSNLEVI